MEKKEFNMVCEAIPSTAEKTLEIIEILRKKGYNDIRLDLNGVALIDGISLRAKDMNEPAFVIANELHFHLTHTQRSKKRHEELKQRQQQVESLRKELKLPDTINISTSSEKFIVSVGDIDNLDGVRELLSKLCAA